MTTVLVVTLCVVAVAGAVLLIWEAINDLMK